MKMFHRLKIHKALANMRWSLCIQWKWSTGSVWSTKQHRG